MYKVSEQYKAAMQRPVQSYRMRGTIGNTVFDDSHILSGSFSITNQCSDETQVLIGQVYIAELKITLLGMEDERYALKDAGIRPFFGMRLADGSYEDIPLGVFTISEANWGNSGVEITAYDNMSKLDRSFSASTLTGTAYRLASIACRSCDLELCTSAEEFASFANGNMTFSLYADNNIESWRTFLSWVAQAVACNVFADREGKIIFRPYDQIPVDTIDAAHRFTGCTFGDYVTRYTGLSCVDIAAQETKYYGEDTDDALTYNLGENPFLQNGDVDLMRKSILTALGSIQYVPFKAEMIGNPAYDLMDVFRFTGGHADDNRLFCMTKFVFSYNQKYEMSGVGKNPALITRNSKSDKDISGLVDEVNSITSSINSLLYDYNTGTLSFCQSERIAGCISYYISKEADVEGHFLMHYRTDQSTTMIVRVYDTTVEELYSPLIYDLPAGDGTIGIPHSYLHRVAGNHEALITVQCTIGTIEVQPRGIFFTINAGNFAEAVDEIGMDIRDISMRQLSESDGPDQIWCAGIENGKLLISRREYKSSSKSVIKWEGVYTPGEALDAAIEFDGSWVLRTGSEKFTIETDDQPWIFWITDETTRTLYAQKGDDETTRFVAAEGVKSVHACKGYSSEMYPEQDQGLVLLYVKTDGSVFYRQYTLNTEIKTKVWSNETEIGKGTEWLEANVHRLNDYRLSFELTSASENLWMITGRTYVGQSIYPENADFNDNNKIGISMFRNGDAIDFTGKAVLFDDPVAPEKVFRIRYPYDIKAFDSSYKSAVTVTLNGKELSGNSYTLSLDGTDLVITTKDEVAATRAKEAVLQVDISAEDTPFYLSNGNGVNRLLLYDQSFSWTIERNITVKNIEIEETVGIHIAATSAITTHQVQNQASIQPNEGTLHAAMTSSFITRQVKETKMTVSDEGELKASVTAEIKTYMTSDAPI